MKEKIPEKAMAEAAVKMRQELTGSCFELDELLRIFQITPIADNIVYEKNCSTDTGIPGKVIPLRKRKRKKKSFFI